MNKACQKLWNDIFEVVKKRKKEKRNPLRTNKHPNNKNKKATIHPDLYIYTHTYITSF